MKGYKILLLLSSLLCLIMLAQAAYEENVLQEWRQIQGRFKASLSPADQAGFSIQLRQVVNPKLKVTDRCVSCHVGMAPDVTVHGQGPLFGAHPKVPHDPAKYGCVVCHGGQGRATTREAAHGESHEAHWPDPIIPKEMAFAGCGSCHTHLTVPSEGVLEHGQGLIERYDCLSCHALDGRGGLPRPGTEGSFAQGPDLTYVGARGFSEAWYETHLKHRRSATGGYWRESFDTIPSTDVQAINHFLRTRVGAPKLVRAKSLFHSLGCRGCHRVSNMGGDDGPELTRVGQRQPSLFDFSAVTGPRSRENWFTQHFIAPDRVVADSRMPSLGLTEPHINLLNYYLLSLRQPELPEAFWPRDRMRALRFNEREFSSDGATLFGTFCAACHGREGEGMRFRGQMAFPAIANPDFLSVASDEFLVQNILRGRPGRRMAAWGEFAQGLNERDAREIVRFLRGLGGEYRPSELIHPKPVVDPEHKKGKQLYAANCAACHGDNGQGGEGPALNNPVFLETADPSFIAATISRGRKGTTMPRFSSASVVHKSLSTQEINYLTNYVLHWKEEQ